MTEPESYTEEPDSYPGGRLSEEMDLMKETMSQERAGFSPQILLHQKRSPDGMLLDGTNRTKNLYVIRTFNRKKNKGLDKNKMSRGVAFEPYLLTWKQFVFAFLIFFAFYIFLDVTSDIFEITHFLS